MDRRRIAGLARPIGAILLCEAAGGVGALATRTSIDEWYATLKKPSFSPPDGVFGPVWTALYALMGMALYDVSRRSTESGPLRLAYAAFGAQLTLNAGWSFLFFGRRSPLYGLVEIVLLWAAIVLTVVAFFRISRPAGLLLLPYLLWTSFAAVLNFSIWRLNRTDSG